MRYLFTYLVMMMALAGCQDKSAESETESEAVTMEKSAQPNPKFKDAKPVTDQPTKEVSLSEMQIHEGYIVYKTFEGGFYAFENDKGARFTLLGLAPEYRRNGLKVSIEGMPLHDVMTITQFGTPFQVNSVTVIDDSGVDDIDK